MFMLHCFTIQVNNNGLISFGVPVTIFSPIIFPLINSNIDEAQLIAPFWGDVDTRGTGRVWYRETTSQADRERAQREIRAIFMEADRFIARMVFIATWDHVGYFDSKTDRVSCSGLYILKSNCNNESSILAGKINVIRKNFASK